MGCIEIVMVNIMVLEVVLIVEVSKLAGGVASRGKGMGVARYCSREVSKGKGKGSKGV